MRNLKKIKISLFFFALLLSNALLATTITWTGNGSGNLWSTSGNWDTGTVPNTSDDVIIPAGSGLIRFNYGNRDVQSLVIETGSTLRILTGRRLNVVGNIPQPLINSGTLFNRGTLDLKNATNVAFINFGSLYNRGLIRINNQNGTGIDNQGQVFNRGNGTIDCEKIYGVMIRTIFGDWLNEGRIRFVAGGEGEHMFVGDGFENTSTGRIEFEDGHPGGFNVYGTSVTNSGIISFVNSTASDYPMYIDPGSSFVNTPSGQIMINSGTGVFYSLMLPINSSFENNGLLRVSGPGSGGGIRVLLASLVNNDGGKIIIDSHFSGLVVSGGSFDNYGSFECTNAGYGISNGGSVLNGSGGKMFFDNMNTGIVLSATGAFTNADAEIEFRNIGSHDIYSRGDFLNTECGYILGDNKIHNSNATMTNKAWMDYPTDGDLHTTFSSVIYNTGIILDPFDRFVDVIDNQEVRVNALVNPQANVPYTNVFDLVNIGNTWIDNFYIDPNLSIIAGSYDYSSNTYVPNNAAIGATALYAKSSVGCTRGIKILINGPIAPITNAPKDQLMLTRQGSANTIAPAKLKNFPNPTTGLFQTQLPTLETTTYELELLNAQGQIMARQQGDSSLGNTATFDLSEYPAGMYWTRLMVDGQLIAQEKIIRLR